MAKAGRFHKLLEPYHIGPVKTRNRMIKPGAAMLYWRETDLHMNGQVMAFYEALAKGGVGLIIVESPIIDYPLGGRWRRRYRIDQDKYIPGLRELTQIIHQYGCPVFMQMNHDGPWQTQPWEASPDIPPLVTAQPIASSAVTMKSMNDFHNEMPRELAIPEIQEIVEKFAGAAVRADQAGFDGVDINTGSSHLLHNFLSPFWNRRKDEYGGTLENRTRFLVSIIREIKKRLGNNFPVCITINGVEMGQLVGIDNSECLTTVESVKASRIFQDAGADAIQVRAHWMGYHPAGFLPEAVFFPEPNIPLKDFPIDYDSRHHGIGAYITLAAAVKKAVTIPVIAVGRIDPFIGEKALREGKADFIAFNRRLIADPELPYKLAAGRLDDITPCTACHTCLDPIEIKHCRINAFLGSDEPWVLKPTRKKKKVLVVGGGPAGMEAARVAALRGHEVTLYEKSSKLGGLIPMAALVKGFEIEDLPAIIRYLEGQIKKLGVKIELGKEVNPATIDALKPDVVILATGGLPATPDISGVDNPIVVSSSEMHHRLKSYLNLMGPGTLRHLTRLWMPLGKKVIIIGGGRHGCELAEFLTKRGRQVTIVDTADAIGEEIFHHLRCALLSWFEKKGVKIITGVKLMEISGKGLNIVTKEDLKQTLLADNIIPAVPLNSNLALLKELEGKVPEIFAIGDCLKPRLIVDAIADGSRIAKAI